MKEAKKNLLLTIEEKSQNTQLPNNKKGIRVVQKQTTPNKCHHFFQVTLFLRLIESVLVKS